MSRKKKMHVTLYVRQTCIIGMEFEADSIEQALDKYNNTGDGILVSDEPEDAGYIDNIMDPVLTGWVINYW